jgi:myo-inositol-hexaphosphate 3-phosphohydrolase
MIRNHTFDQRLEWKSLNSQHGGSFMKCLLKTLLLSTMASLSVFETAPAQTIARGPYLQIGTPSSVTVRWRTNQATDSRVRYGVSPSGLTMTADEATSTTEHIVPLSGLLPDTKYYYSIGTTTSTMAGGDTNHYFITAPAPGTAKPTRVWVLGDAGTQNNNQRAVRDSYYSFTGNRHTDLWLMLGDNAYDSGTDSEYQDAVFENMYEAMLVKSVLWPTRGNHEKSENVYYQIFSMPPAAEAGGIASGTEAYYSFDYGNIHFICLESVSGTLRATNSAMWIWLEADLAANDKNWTIAFWHHPPYSKGSHNSDSESELIEMRERGLPILEEGGVDLVLCGHSHSYERSYLLDGHYGKSNTLTASMKLDAGDGRSDGDSAYTKPTPTPNPHDGVVYVVAGSSGKTSGGSLNHPAMFISLNVLGSMVLDIDGNRLDAKFLDDKGAVRDYFTMLKPSVIVGPATQLIMISGDNQSGQAGAALAAPFVVEARDANNNPVPSVSVTFAVTSGGGSLSNAQPQLTGADGRASTILTLGASPGANTVMASADGLIGSPALFTAAGVEASGNPPNIISFSPSNGDVGVEVTITGANFTGAMEVKFNATPADTFFVDSHAQIRANVPVGASSGKISITTPAGTATSADSFTVNTSSPGTVTVNPKLGPLKPGDNADDPAIWIHPSDHSKSLIFLSDKDAGIFAYDVNGALLQHVDFDTRLNNIDLRTGFQFGGETFDILAGNLRSVGKLAVLKINPDYSCSGPDTCAVPPLTVLADKNSSGNDISDDSYGFTLYRRSSDGTVFVFDKPASDDPIKQYRVDGSSGQIVVTLERTIDDVSIGQAEGFVADDDLGYVYFAEESKGIHKYNADPISSQLTRLLFFASGDGTASDREGLCLYKCDDGTGYIILSSQGNSSFKVYERQGDNQFVKTFIAGQATSTDGLDVSSGSIPGFPNGFVVVHDDPEMQYYVYDWAEIAELDLTVCPDGAIQPAAPELASFDPSSGPAGVEVTIIGNNFLGATLVAFNGSVASTFIVDSNSQIRAVVPIGATTGAISVTTSAGTATSASDFTVIITSVEEADDALPKTFRTACYPNPFNAQITIEYTLPEAGPVRLSIFNALGQVVRTLLDDRQAAGTKRLVWDGRDQQGATLGSGLYFYQIDFGQQRLTRKMILQQ